MSSVQNSVDTVNAAATAIVTAESRVQPTTVQKRRWGSCWKLYWCFGSYKNTKRIGHAVLVPEPTVPGDTAPVAENLNPSTTIVLPFIAPPSSPASFLQSDPPSSTQSPAGLLSLTSLSVNAYALSGTAPIFMIGPYAHETQSVSPPVFSTFTTEPSTASFTPPPESLQITRPSSPEVPFAQLLTSSLAHKRRNSATNQKFSLSQYEFQLYQPYPGSPNGHFLSRDSAISNSGTSSPFPDKRPIIEVRMGGAPKFIGYEHFSTRKWGSRVGSGSLTPNGWGSRLGSGTLTPNGWGSRLGSGTLTPNGLDSRLGSGTLTPNDGEPASRDSFLLENQISEVASLANSDHGSQNEEVVIDHRVSFELTGENLPHCLEKEYISSHETTSASLLNIQSQETIRKDVISKKAEIFCEHCAGEAWNEMPGKSLDGEVEQCHHKHRSISLGSSKDFNFDNTKGEVSEKPTINNWTFFPMLQPSIS